METRIVLVGAGHAHLHVLAGARALTDAGHAVTLVSPGRFWYSGMGPGVLSGRYSADEDTIDAGRLVEQAGGTHVDGRVASLDADARTLTLEDGTHIAWDYLSLNVGSGVPAGAIPGADEHATPVKPVSNFDALRRRWLANEAAARREIVVIGGGAAGCETAMAARRLFEDAGAEARITLVAGSDGVLDGWPDRARRVMRSVCDERGVALIEGARVTRIDHDACTLHDGRRLPCDDAVLATGVRPAPLIAASTLTTDDVGAMVVDDALRSVSHPRVLGGGDCIALRSRRLPRVGVYAVRQGPVLLENLGALAAGRAPETFEPQSSVLLILNLSDGTGLLSWRGIVSRGRAAFRFKEWLDRGFVERYRA